MQKTIQPINGYLLLKPIVKEKKEGLYIPDKEEKEQTAEVIAVKEDCEVKVGYIVIYKQWEVNKVNGEELILVKLEDILAIVK